MSTLFEEKFEMENLKICIYGLVSLVSLALCGSLVSAEDNSGKTFQAGVFSVDITPTEFPVIVNGYFTERTAEKAFDRLMSRALVLDDGETRIAIVVVDNLMIPRGLLDEAKQIASEATGIPVDRMLISATHTHSAPSAMACLGSRVDRKYESYLPSQIAKSIVLANKQLIPASIGWTVVDAGELGHCRRWIYRPDHIQLDPFGERTVRAHMHPGHLSEKHIGPAGPDDPDLSLIAVKSSDGRLLSVLGNFAMHFYGASPLSADVCGLFGMKFEELLDESEVHPNYVGMLSQGTSGDAAWMDYSQATENRIQNKERYTVALAKLAVKGYRSVDFKNWFSLAMAEEKLKFSRRIPDSNRLQKSKEIVDGLDGKLPTQLSEIYAQEQLDLHTEPQVEIKLQAIRIGELGITALPHEVYALTGLKLKSRSPLKTTFNIELANGAQGYIPPPEQHQLGGYTTWPAKTAGLETQAEPQIVETLLSLLEKVSGKDRNATIPPESPYASTVLKSKPIAYWSFEELDQFTAIDRQQNVHGTFEPGVARYLPGPDGMGVDAGLRGNRAVHFAGGRMKAEPKDLKDVYSIECWFWNGLPHNVRPVTGYFFSRGLEDDFSAAGDHLGIGGTYQEGMAAGKLIFFNGNQTNQLLVGNTELKLRTWYHLVLVRNRQHVTVYLNGNLKPEIEGEIDTTLPADAHVFVGGRNDRFANFEGKVDEVSIYSRELSHEEIFNHYQEATGDVRKEQ